MNYTDKEKSLIEAIIVIGVLFLFIVSTIYLGWYFDFILLGAYLLFSIKKKESEISYLVAIRNVVRTFTLLLIPYLIATKLLYPVEFFPRPIYSFSFLALISLLSVNSRLSLGKTEVKFDALKRFLSVRTNAIQTFGLFFLNFFESLNHKSTLPGMTLAVLSLIVAYVPLRNSNKQIFALAYFFSTVFLFLSFL